MYRVLKCPNCAANGKNRTIARIFAGSAVLQTQVRDSRREFVAIKGEGFEFECTCHQQIITSNKDFIYIQPMTGNSPDPSIDSESITVKIA